MSTGKQKQASTGSPKTQTQASTGSPKTKTKASTGSPKSEKGFYRKPEDAKTGFYRKPQEQNPKKKKVDILAREAAAVLAGLSTPPKPKGKRKRDPPLYFKARRSVRIKTGQATDSIQQPNCHRGYPCFSQRKVTLKDHSHLRKGKSKEEHMARPSRPVGRENRLQEAEKFYRIPWLGYRKPKKEKEKDPHHQGRVR